MNAALAAAILQSANPEILIHIQNQAAIQEAQLQKSREIVERIFQDAGVTPQWAPAPPEGKPFYSMVLTPGPMPGAGPNAAGFAIPQARRAYTWMTGEHPDDPVMLGHQMAHELGHVLGLEHVRRGLMSGHLGAYETVTDAKTGRLLFDAKQAETIRRALTGK